MTAARDDHKVQANLAYNRMFEAARTWLAERDYAEMAALSGGIYDAEQKMLRLSSMGQPVEISLPAFTCLPELENWQHLVLLHYLKNADGTTLTHELTAFRNMVDGMIRGTKFERTANEVFQRILKNKTQEDVLTACRSMGAEEVKGRGDISVCIPFLPHCPVYLNVWLADEEFAANGKMFFDRSVDHYLSIEDAVTVGEIILNRLEKRL